ncbi:MAG: DUF2281 domain-containing protein [Thiohalorhabdaceae bacterium]
MSIADRIYEEVRRLPEPLTQEVLDFIGYLEAKHGLSETGLEELKKAQEPAMEHTWGNSEDEVWDEW